MLPRRISGLVLATIVATLTLALAAHASAAPPRLVAWGYNGSGALGNGNLTNSDVPVPVSGLGEVSAMAAGGYHGLALPKGGGSLMAWGENCCGQLGDETTTNSDVPVAVHGINGVEAIAGGGYHSLALLGNGTVMAWGDNQGGQLGNETTVNRGVPVAVGGLNEVAAVAGGSVHSLALLKDGTVKAWGDNGSGQLGDGTTNDSPVPVPVSGLSEVKEVVGGYWHSLALLKNGKVMAWGDNRDGQLGDGSSTGPEMCEYEFEAFPCSRTPVPVSGLSEVTAIAGDNVHGLALLKDGTVMAWGDNRSGQLGDGTSTGPESCALACSRVPVPVSGLSEVSAIAGGGYHSLALLKNGKVMAWGEGASGQLGNGTTMNSDVPMPVAELSGVTAIAAGYADSLAVGVIQSESPTVTHVEPSNGPAAGGTSVTITGTNLTGATAVHFGASAAASFSVNSETSITAVSPAGTGTVDVTVTTPTATSPTSGADQFSYAAEPAPTVTGVKPNAGPQGGGTAVTVTGTHFGQATAVKFGSTAAQSFQVNSATSITAVSPPAAGGIVDVTVANATGTSATGTSDRFGYTVSSGGGHWYRSRTLTPAGERIPILEWGTLSLSFEPGIGPQITCEYAAGGFVENPEGGSAGIGQISSLATYNCVMAFCPPGKSKIGEGEYEKEPLVTAEALPWPSVLTDEEGVTKIRDESSGVRIAIGCVAHGSRSGPPGSPGYREPIPFAEPAIAETTPEKLMRPLVELGKNTTVTTKLAFDAKAGAMSIGGGVGAEKVAGKLKIIAYKESELITAQDP